MLKPLLWICLLTVLHILLVQASGSNSSANGNSTSSSSSSSTNTTSSAQTNTTSSASTASSASTTNAPEKSQGYSFEYGYAQNIAASKDSFLTECTNAIKPAAKCTDVKATGVYTVLSVNGTSAAIDTLTNTISGSGLVLPSFKLPTGKAVVPTKMDFNFTFNFQTMVGNNTRKTQFLAECSTYLDPATCMDVKQSGAAVVLNVTGDTVAVNLARKKLASAMKLPTFASCGVGSPIIPTVTRDLQFDYDYSSIQSKENDFIKECNEALAPVTCKEVKRVSVVTVVTIVGEESAVNAKEKDIKDNGFKLQSFGELGSCKEITQTTGGPALPFEEVKFDVDFDQTVGNKKNLFLDECSEALTRLKCVDVRKGSVIVKIAGQANDLTQGMHKLKTTGLSLPTFSDLGKGAVIEPIQLQEVSFNKDYNQIVGNDKAKMLAACNAMYKASNVTCEDMRSGSIILRLKGPRDKLTAVVSDVVQQGLALEGIPFGVATKLGVVTTQAPILNTPETPLISTEGPAVNPADTTAQPSTTDEESLTTKSTTPVPIDVEKWTYPARNDEWGGLCAKGDSQSPIDLPELTAAQEQYPFVEYTQYRKVAMIGVDSGVGLKWNPKRGEPSLGYLTLENAKFNLMYWTLHTGSEHTSNGKQFDMEIQFYHKSDFGKLVVVSVLCSVMPLRKASAFWAQIRDSMSEPADTDPMLLFRDIQFDTSRWFEYEGSLTFPPCDQGITWIILADQCSVPHNFYKYVTSFDSMQGNFRTPQPIGKRKVLARSGVFSGSWQYPARNDEWGGMCLRGKEQSPLDFDLEVMTRMKMQRNLLGDITGGQRRWYGHNTGHTLKWKQNSKGSGINYKGSFWKLQNFHLHTKSEHTIAGGQYDMELVFVHKNSNDELLNIAVLCKGEDFGQNPFFDGLRESMTGDGKKRGFVADYKEEVMRVLGDTTQYMRYRGSNTVPPCNEGVEWIVMASLLKVPKDFLIWLKQFKSMKYNFRRTQPWNGRIIFTSNEASVGSGILHGYSSTQIIQLVSGLGLLFAGLLILLDCRISWKAPRSDQIPLLGASAL